MQKGVYVDEQFLAHEIGSSAQSASGSDSEILFVRIKKSFFTGNAEAGALLAPGVQVAVGHIAPATSTAGHSHYYKLEYLAIFTVNRVKSAPNGDYLLEGYRDTHYRREFV